MKNFECSNTKPAFKEELETDGDAKSVTNRWKLKMFQNGINSRSRLGEHK
jgi:hypothetical protein